MTSSPGENVLCHYHYDPLDRLISHSLPDTPGRQRFYCKSRLTTEIQGAMCYSIVQHGDQLLAQRRSEGDAPATTLLATDQQRSVLQTVEVNHPTPPIAYTPYGHRTGESGLLSLLAFNGERPDAVTRCYLLGNGYRAFNPLLMRFNSPDSLSPFGEGGLNSYTYCWGDPINLMDPIGHSPIAQAFMSKTHTYINKSASRSVRKKIIKTRTSSPNAVKELLTEKATELKTLFDETNTLTAARKDTGDISKFRIPATLELATDRYFHHYKEGIRYNKSGIPAPKKPIIAMSKSGQEVLRTDFFEDAAAFFHHLANEHFPKKVKKRREEAAGKTIIKRVQYIRDYALRHFKPE